MIEIKKSATVTNAGLETVLELDRLDANQLHLEIANSAAAALAAMELAIKVHKDGAWHVIADDAGDYAAPVGFLWSSDTGFFTLAAGATGFLTLSNLEAIYGVRVRAQSAGAGSVLTVLGQMGPN
jgi:3-hydroxy-3-methylglutaryl CoA synthase